MHTRDDTTAVLSAAGVTAGRASGTAVVALFTATAFLSAFLLFLVQPMVAKLVLPPYGGSASVWNTTNAFFQATLLAGYAYGHVLTRRVRRRRQVAAHAVVLLLPLVALPLALPGWASPPADRPPALWLALVLTVAVGAPFLAVSTTGPLLQRWFSYTDHRRAEDPYFLYSAGNVGSFLALLAYPVVVEPRWTVASQARGWAGAYVVLVALVGACGWLSRGRARSGVLTDLASATHAPTQRPSWTQRARWLVLAAVPSSLMLGFTSFLTADLAAMPLLWVLPLSLYLATFVVAFGRPDSVDLRAPMAVLTITAIGAAVVSASSVDIGVLPTVLVHLFLFAAGAYVAHRKLALDRPSAEHLTGFYLVVALGGVVGGGFNAFVAPLLFDRVIEYPLAILAAAILGLGGSTSAIRHRYGAVGLSLEAFAGFGICFAGVVVAGGESRFVVATVILLIGAVALGARRLVPALGVGAAALMLVHVLAPVSGGAVMLESRTFFGVYRVEQTGSTIQFVSGSTSHGTQDSSRPDEPLSYYTRQGPVGQVMRTYGPTADDVGLIGLGAGAMAAYGEPGQRYTFYEIDPEVVRIARDSGYFTYLQESRADVEVEIGDGRIRLADPATPDFDVLVLDAFSGDAIPIHLLTTEAFQLYRGHLADGGVLAVHISNRYLDLRPVVAGAASELGMAALVRRDRPGANTDASWWMVLADDPATLDRLAADDRWHPADEAGTATWTDDRSNLLAVLGVEPPEG